MTDKAISNTTPSHYSAADQRFHNLRPSVYLHMGWRERFSVLRRLLFTARSRMPEQRLPEVTPNWREFLRPDSKTRIIWFGHSSLLLNMAGITVLIDPVFSASAAPFPFRIRRFQPPVVPMEALPAIDVIVLSHNHYDHLDRVTLDFFRDKKTHFFTPLGMGKILQKWGIAAERITERDWYEGYTWKTLTLTATPARHASGRTPFDHNRTLWCSWVLQSSDETLYYSGDSAYDDHFAAIRARFGPIDLAFVENGQYNRRWPDSHMTPEQTIQAVLDLAPRTFVPIHWGMFTLSLHHWTEPVQRSQLLAAQNGIQVLCPRLGEVVDSHSLSAPPLWWMPFVPEKASLRLPPASQGTAYTENDSR